MKAQTRIERLERQTPLLDDGQDIDWAAMTIQELKAMRDANGPYKRDARLDAAFKKMTIEELKFIRGGGDPAPIFKRYGVTL